VVSSLEELEEEEEPDDSSEDELAELEESLEVEALEEEAEEELLELELEDDDEELDVPVEELVEELSELEETLVEADSFEDTEPLLEVETGLFVDKLPVVSVLVEEAAELIEAWETQPPKRVVEVTRSSTRDFFIR
jgi:hypothetical protein